MNYQVAVNAKANDPMPSRSDNICLNAVEARKMEKGKTYFLHTAWGFKRIRYCTASWDCVTGVTDSYIDQQTYMICADTPVYPVESLIRAGIVREVH